LNRLLVGDIPEIATLHAGLGHFLNGLVDVCVKGSDRASEYSTGGIAMFAGMR